MTARAGFGEARKAPIVVENKLYSVPYPEQLIKYNAYPLPWSADHDERGARDARYVLLSLMKPSFPLPRPWVHVGYQDLARALDLVDASSLDRTGELFRALPRPSPPPGRARRGRRPGAGPG